MNLGYKSEDSDVTALFFCVWDIFIGNPQAIKN